MKTVYLVRHGQTESNAIQAFTPPDEPLSELGLRQAESVAGRLRREKVDRIISSPLERTRQTAAAIESALGLPVTYSDLFVETRGASAIYGKSATDPEAIKIRDLVQEHWGDPTWKHSDEENFFEASARARQALAYLEEQPEEHILVVGHANFTRMLLYGILLGDLLTPEATVAMRKSTVMGNTGITVFQLNEWGRWKLVRWNDTVHLGLENKPS